VTDELEHPRQHHVLVLPDREAAEAVAEELTDRCGLREEPQLLREELAGEDDAEDAQWLVVPTGDTAPLGESELDTLAQEYDGWLER
jgi:hypothetical protein